MPKENPWVPSHALLTFASSRGWWAIASHRTTINYMESVQVREVLIAGEVAELLRISRRKFDALCARGEGPPSFLIGSKRLWRWVDVSAWITQKVDSPIPNTDEEPPAMT